MRTEVERRVDVLHQTIIALIYCDGRDLSARQLGVFLPGLRNFLRNAIA
jgi:hypothetical protein